jgi:hypothetical protein
MGGPPFQRAQSDLRLKKIAHPARNRERLKKTKNPGFRRGKSYRQYGSYELRARRRRAQLKAA